MGMELERREDALHYVIEGIAGATGEEFFHSLVKHLANALEVRYSFATECTDHSQVRVRSLAFWDGNGFAKEVEYPLTGTPCEKVIDGDICSYSEQLQLLFPLDKDLVALGVESYLGVPLKNFAGKVLGHLVVMDTKPRVFYENEQRILRVFATRAGSELERIRAYSHVQLLNSELGVLLDVNRAIGRYLDRDKLFGAIAGCLKTLVPTERFGIELPIEGDQLQGHILSTIPTDETPTEPTVLPAPGTACDWVVRHRLWFVADSRDEFRERFPVTFEVMTSQ